MGMEAWVVPVHKEVILPKVMVGGTGAFNVTVMEVAALAHPVDALDKTTSIGYTPAAPDEGMTKGIGLDGNTCDTTSENPCANPLASNVKLYLSGAPTPAV